MLSTAADLFDRYHLAVFRYFRRLTGRADVAEDLTQEVFLRVVRGARDYEDRGRQAAWVFQIARNLMVDEKRRNRPHLVPISEQTAAAPSSAESEAALQEALDLLPAPDRAMFLLREVAGLTYAEIARICETTEDGVGSRLSRARLRLRRILSNREDRAAGA